MSHRIDLDHFSFSFGFCITPFCIPFSLPNTYCILPPISLVSALPTDCRPVCSRIHLILHHFHSTSVAICVVRFISVFFVLRYWISFMFFFSPPPFRPFRSLPFFSSFPLDFSVSMWFPSISFQYSRFFSFTPSFRTILRCPHNPTGQFRSKFSFACNEHHSHRLFRFEFQRYDDMPRVARFFGGIFSGITNQSKHIRHILHVAGPARYESQLHTTTTPAPAAARPTTTTEIGHNGCYKQLLDAANTKRIRKFRMLLSFVSTCWPYWYADASQSPCTEQILCAHNHNVAFIVPNLKLYATIC